MLSPQSRTRLLSSCSSQQRSPSRSSPSQVMMQVDVAHPPALPAGWRREPAPDQVGARAPGPAAGTVAPGPFGVAAAWRALGAHGRERTASGGCLNASAGPGGVGCGGSPQGGAGAVEDPLDQSAEPLYLRRAGPDGRLPVQAQYPDLETLRQRHTDGDRAASCLPRGTITGEKSSMIRATMLR